MMPELMERNVVPAIRVVPVRGIGFGPSGGVGARGISDFRFQISDLDGQRPGGGEKSVTGSSREPLTTLEAGCPSVLERGCGVTGDPSPAEGTSSDQCLAGRLPPGCKEVGGEEADEAAHERSGRAPEFSAVPPVPALAEGGPGRNHGTAGVGLGNFLADVPPANVPVICAWCEAENPQITRISQMPGRVSHGICPRHLAGMRAQLAASDWRAK